MDSPSVRRSWTERTKRWRRSRTGRRNPRRWSSNWRRRVRDGGAWGFTRRMFTRLSLHTQHWEACSTVDRWKVMVCSCAAQFQHHKTLLLVFGFLLPVPVWHLPSVFVHLLKRFHGKNTFAVMPLWALFCSNQNFDLLIAHQSHLHVCMCV